MIKAVFFDLDGTLLPMEQDVFTKAYFGSLAKRLSLIGYDSDRLIKSIWAGSASRVKNDGTKSNEDAFWESFNRSYGKMRERTKTVFISITKRILIISGLFAVIIRIQRVLFPKLRIWDCV